MSRDLRVGIFGCGTIGEYVLDAITEGKVPGATVVAVCGRSKGKDKVTSLGIEWLTDPALLLERDINVVVEAASHEAVEIYGARMLRQGIDFIPLSLGALVDADLLSSLVEAASQGNSVLYVPSGGIVGLDTLQAAMVAGVDKVTMTSRKPPRAWKGIPYVEQLGLDLDNMAEPTLLYDGPARDCVKKFPQNINIAAALSLAGLGFDSTHIRILADPDIALNTHEIVCEGMTGRFTIKLKNVPKPDNPKTSYLAATSAVAALMRLRSPYRVGT